MKPERAKKPSQLQNDHLRLIFLKWNSKRVFWRTNYTAVQVVPKLTSIIPEREFLTA